MGYGHTLGEGPCLYPRCRPWTTYVVQWVINLAGMSGSITVTWSAVFPSF